jgi:hypothetical protein
MDPAWQLSYMFLGYGKADGLMLSLLNLLEMYLYRIL